MTGLSRWSRLWRHPQGHLHQVLSLWLSVYLLSFYMRHHIMRIVVFQMKVQTKVIENKRTDRTFELERYTK